MFRLIGLAHNDIVLSHVQKKTLCMAHEAEPRASASGHVEESISRTIEGKKVGDWQLGLRGASTAL